MSEQFTDHSLYGRVSEDGDVYGEVQVKLKPVSDINDVLERSNFFIEDNSQESINNRKHLKSLLAGIEELRELSNKKLTEIVNIHLNTNDNNEMIIEDSDLDDSDDEEEEGDRNISMYNLCLIHFFKSLNIYLFLL